jgi:coenzyme F420-reducing hydrogenase delta subunit
LNGIGDFRFQVADFRLKTEEDERVKIARQVGTRGKGRNGWRPSVRMFYCQCAGGGAALDFEPPEEFSAEMVPCTGKIHTQRLVKAFEGGADGVCIIGCPPGECRMVEGSLRASRRAAFVHKLLDEIGVGGERIEVVLPQSGPEALEEAVRSLLRSIVSLGPSALRLANAQV